MVETRTSRHVDAPPAEVFSAAADFARAPERIAGIERVELLTEGPVGVGTRFRETRVMFKKEVTEELEVVAFEPPRSYTLQADSCGARFVTELRFEPERGGTRVEMHTVVTPQTLFAKLMTPVSALMMGSMKKVCARDLDDLAASLGGGRG